MKELLSGLIGSVTGIINKVVPDKDEAARLAHEISIMADRHAQELASAQVEMNKEEAAGTGPKRHYLHGLPSLYTF